MTNRLRFTAHFLLSYISMLTRSIEGKVKDLYTFGRQHVRLWSRALGTAERGATPTGIVLEPLSLR